MLAERPNIAKLYEVIYHSNSSYIYLVIEYCELGTLMIRRFEDLNYYHNYNFITKLLDQLPDSTELLAKLDESKFFDDEETTEVLIKQNVLPFQFKLKIARSIFRVILEEVVFLHNINVAHRDIKPDNICINAKLSIKLIDFSISKRFKDIRNEMIAEPGGTMHFQGSYYIYKYKLLSILILFRAITQIKPIFGH